VRKPLVAIILNILKSMFYITVERHNMQPFALSSSFPTKCQNVIHMYTSH